MSSAISDSTDFDSTIAHHSHAAANTLSLLNTPNSPLGQKLGSATFKARLYVTAGVPFYRSRTKTSTTPCRDLALKRCSGSRRLGKTEHSPARTGTSFLLSTAARQTKVRVYQGWGTLLHRRGVGLRMRSAVRYLATESTLAISSSCLGM